MTKYRVWFLPKEGSDLKYPENETFITARNKDELRLKTINHPLMKKAYDVHYQSTSNPNSTFYGQMYNGPSTAEPLWWEQNVLYRVDMRNGKLIQFEKGILANPHLRWNFATKQHIAKFGSSKNDPDTLYALFLEKSGDYAVKVWNSKQHRYVRVPQDKIPAWAKKRRL